MVADISGPRRFVFERPVGAYWQYQRKLSGPDLTQGVALSMVPDGTMLLGHARGELVLLVRRGDELLVPSARHYGAPLEQGLLVGDTVRCPWHHACFSLRTDEALRASALEVLY